MRDAAGLGDGRNGLVGDARVEDVRVPVPHAEDGRVQVLVTEERVDYLHEEENDYRQREENEGDLEESIEKDKFGKGSKIRIGKF